MANYLVTGGAGFIGSHIVAALVARGDMVRVLDDLVTGNENNLAGVKDKIEFIAGDIRDPQKVADAVVNIDYVIHQAALPSVVRSFLEPAESLSVNTGGTLQMLTASVNAKVKTFVYASSSSVYGDGGFPLRTEDMPTSPLSPYAEGKLLGEQYCVLFKRLYGLNTIALRYFNVFGPRQNPKSMYAAVIPKFVSALMKGEEAVIYGDGTQTRDFTYVANVVAANLKAAAAKDGSIYNIACGQETDLNALYKQISQILNSDKNPKHEASRPGDVYRSCARVDKATTELGYQPEVTLAAGLEKTIEWFKENEE